MRIDAMRWSHLALALAVTAIGPGVARAQVVANVERKLLPLQLGPLDSLPKSFWESLAFLRDEEDRQRALKADITFGLSGDDAGQKSLYKLNTGISLTRGDFPSELTVVSKLGLQLRDGVLQEDVTTLQITYDYHTSSALEYFSFAERFTDSFLSIQQRYEIGFGARLAKEVGFVSGGPRAAEWIDQVRTVFAPMREMAAMPGAQRPVPLSVSDIDRFDAATGNLQHAIRDREARVVVGLSASIFAEIERAGIDAVSVPVSGSGAATDSIKSNIQLASVQRYRFSLRPTLRLRPSPDVSIRIFPYFKLPLGAPVRSTDANGHRRLDYRRDIYSELAWSVKQDETGLENVEFVITFNHYFDNVPPSLSPSVIAAELARGRVFTATEAERSHRFVALALRLRW